MCLFRISCHIIYSRTTDSIGGRRQASGESKNVYYAFVPTYTMNTYRDLWNVYNISLKNTANTNNNVKYYKGFVTPPALNESSLSIEEVKLS